MANLQGRPSRSLQGMRAYLQGFGGAGYVYFTKASYLSFSALKGSISATTDAQYSTHMSYGTGNGQSIVSRGMRIYRDKIYLCDTASNRVQILSDNFVFDSSFGSTGTGDGQFQLPYGISVFNDNIYVGDGMLDYVQVFDLSGNFVDKFGTPGPNPGEINRLIDVFCYGNYIYVRHDDYINIYDLDYNYVSRFGGYGSGDGQFLGSHPNTIAAIGDELFVVDYFETSPRIQKFDLDGSFISKYQNVGSGYGELSYTTSMTAFNQSLYVIDWFNEKILVLDSDFNVQREVIIDSPYSSGILTINITVG